jgi:hypothetical protein
MLRRSILGIVASLALASFGLAQDKIDIRPNLKGGVTGQANAGDQPKSEEESGKSPPIGPYAFAILATILVAAVICAPSRKA